MGRVALSEGLAADIGLALGTLELNVALSVEPGETVAVLGPNGAGKTTVLRALAGLLAIDRGAIRLDGAVLDDPAADRFVKPEDRPVAMVFQGYELFGHLRVVDNVAFGLRARGVGRTEARRRAREWLDRLGLADRADDRPGALSGGQGQRVALARALAVEPQLLLLDEPLAALDASTRRQVRRQLAGELGQLAPLRVVVAHDPLDVAALADRVVVLEHGRVSQAGRLDAFAARPRSRYVADLVGTNLLEGRVEAVGAGPAGPVTVALAGGGVMTGSSPEPQLNPGVSVFAVVHPRSVALHPRPPEGSPRNVWPATVSGIEMEGARVRVQLDGAPSLAAEVTPAAVAALALEPGGKVWAAVKASEVDVSAA